MSFYQSVLFGVYVGFFLIFGCSGCLPIKDDMRKTSCDVGDIEARDKAADEALVKFRNFLDEARAQAKLAIPSYEANKALQRMAEMQAMVGDTENAVITIRTMGGSGEVPFASVESDEMNYDQSIAMIIAAKIRANLGDKMAALRLLNTVQYKLHLTGKEFPFHNANAAAHLATGYAHIGEFSTARALIQPLKPDSGDREFASKEIIFMQVLLGNSDEVELTLKALDDSRHDYVLYCVCLSLVEKEKFSDAIELAKTIELEGYRDNIYAEIAVLQIQKNDFVGAEDAIFLIEDLEKKAMTWGESVGALSKESRASVPARFISEALKAARQVPEGSCQAEVLSQIAIHQFVTGNSKEANELLEDARTVLTRGGDRWAVASIVVAYAVMGMPEKAMELAGTGEKELFKDRVLSLLAEEQSKQGDLAEAQKNADKIESPLVLTKTLTTIAASQLRKGERIAAIENVNKAIAAIGPVERQSHRPWRDGDEKLLAEFDLFCLVLELGEWGDASRILEMIHRDYGSHISMWFLPRISYAQTTAGLEAEPQALVDAQESPLLKSLIFLGMAEAAFAEWKENARDVHLLN